MGEVGVDQCNADGEDAIDRALHKTKPRHAGGVLVRCGSAQFSLRRREAATPARPRPSSASVPGSGSGGVWSGVFVRRKVTGGVMFQSTALPKVMSRYVPASVPVRANCIGLLVNHWTQSLSPPWLCRSLP